MMNRSLWSASWHGVPGGLLAWPVCFCIATSKKRRVLEHLVERLEDTMALRYNKRLCASFVRTLVYVPSFGVLAHTPQSSRSKSFALRRTSLPTEPQSATQRAVGESRALLSSADPQSLRPRWRRKERGWHAVGIPTRACASRAVWVWCSGGFPNAFTSTFTQMFYVCRRVRRVPIGCPNRMRTCTCRVRVCVLPLTCAVCRCSVPESGSHFLVHAFLRAAVSDGVVSQSLCF